MSLGGVLQGTKHVTAGLLAITLLGGCGAIQKAQIPGFQVKQNPVQRVDNLSFSERGLGKLAKGDLLAAQALFDQALQINPRDVHALLGKAIIYERTNQPTAAAASYEAILSLRPNINSRMIVMNKALPRPVGEIASVNLSLLRSQEVAEKLGTAPPAMDPEAEKPYNAAIPQMNNQMAAAPMPQQMAQPGGPMVTPLTPPPGMPMQVLQSGQHQPQMAMRSPTIVPETEDNVVARFKILRTLRERGLVTPDEYNVRRAANIGALLPLTAPPPAAGLARTVPSGQQIIQRLQAIGRALEMKAITVRQHNAERSVIIDGLMPAAPHAIANPGIPPQGLLEAADEVRRLERLLEEGLITSDEALKERNAIEANLQPKPPAMPNSMPGAMSGQQQKPAEHGENKMTTDAPKVEMMKDDGPRPGLHLASYRSEADANRGWTQLRRAFRSLIGDLHPEVVRVNLGPGKGVYYRLIVGPLANQAEVTRICKNLKDRRQYCEPAFVGAG